MIVTLSGNLSLHALDFSSGDYSLRRISGNTDYEVVVSGTFQLHGKTRHRAWPAVVCLG